MTSPTGNCTMFLEPEVTIYCMDEKGELEIWCKLVYFYSKVQYQLVMETDVQPASSGH